MDPSQQWRFQVGDEVCSADDHKLGKVVAVQPDAMRPVYLVVEKGLLRKHELTVPVSAVCNYDDGTIYVDLTKDAAESTGAAPGTAQEEQAW